jgi:hypothetical protein
MKDLAISFFFWLADFLVTLYYDYFLTLAREIQFLWPPHNKQSWFTVACLLNRYIPIIGVLPVFVTYFLPVNPAVRPSSFNLQSSMYLRTLTELS